MTTTLTLIKIEILLWIAKDLEENNINHIHFTGGINSFPIQYKLQYKDDFPPITYTLSPCYKNMNWSILHKCFKDLLKTYGFKEELTDCMSLRLLNYE